MIERLPKLVVAGGILAVAAAAFFAAWIRPFYFTNQTILGGLLFLELLVASIFLSCPASGVPLCGLRSSVQRDLDPCSMVLLRGGCVCGRRCPVERTGIAIQVVSHCCNVLDLSLPDVSNRVSAF